MAQNNPYIGPRTFQRNEGHLFFGREREARDLIALVASERLVVFYAQSGAGKSSIVNTRLIPNLESKEYEVLPVGRISGDLTAGESVDNIYIHNLIRSFEQHDTDSKTLDSLTLSDFLAHLNYDDKGFFYDPTPVEIDPAADPTEVARRALIIDQFEELFSTYPESWEKRENFFGQLAKAMADDPQLWIVLVMREDYVAALDPYAHIVSNGLRVRYYMQRLGREAALKAVKSPVEGIRPYAEGVAEKLIDDLCSIKVQKPDGTLDVQPGQYAEPVQMQVVCYGLWDNLPADGTQISEKDLQDVGDVNQSLGKYYDKRVGEVAKAKNVRERLIREWFEKKLITTGGIRNMVLQEREPKPGELHDDVIQALQSDLVRGEKRGGATWYELTHDRLVEPVLERNKIWFAEHLSPLQRQAALWKDQDQHESWLRAGDALDEFEAWAKEHQDELTETEEDFLEACRKLQAQIDERQAAERNRLEMAQKIAEEQARSARRARIFNVVSAVLIVIAVIATIYAFGQSREALHQSDIAHSGELATTALERSDSQLDLAMLLGVQAYTFSPTSQSQKNLLSLLQKSGRFVDILDTQDDLQAIQFNPMDGKTFTSLDKNGIMFWDASSREALTNHINNHFKSVTAIALSEDESLLASGASDGSIVLWNTQTGQTLSKEPFETSKNKIANLAFNPQDNTLASTSWDVSNIILWDVTTDPGKPQPIGTLTKESTGNPVKLAFSPDGKTLASGSSDGAIIVWDLKTRTSIRDTSSNKKHTSEIFELAFIKEGTILISAGDSKIIFWSVNSLEQPLGEIPNEASSSIYRVAISPDERTLATALSDGSIILWNIADIKKPAKISEAFNQKTNVAISDLAFNAAGNLLATGSYQGVVLWDVKVRSNPQKISVINSLPLNRMIFSGDGKALITGSSDSTILYWDITKPKTPTKSKALLEGHPGEPNGMQFSPDGSILESYGEDGSILIDANTLTELGHGYFATSPDAKTLMYQILDQSTGENTMYLRDIETGKPIGNSIPGQYPIFSPDSKKIAYQTYDPSGQPQLHLWDVTSKKELKAPGLGNYPPFSDSGTLMKFSPDSGILVYQTPSPDDGSPRLNLWDIAAEKNIGKDVDGSFLNISPDGKILICQTSNADDEKQIVLWNIASPDDSKTLPGNLITLSQNGKVLVYSTTEASINVMDTTTGLPLVDPILKGSFYSLSAKGKIMLYYSNDEENNQSFINALDTDTGKKIFSDPFNNSWFNNATESGPIYAYQFYNNGEDKIGLINTSTPQKIGEPIKGFSPSLSPDGEILMYQVYENNSYKFNWWNTTQNNLILGPIAGENMGLFQDNQLLIYQTAESAGNKVNLFDLKKRLKIGEPVNGKFLALSPDGKTLITKSETNAVFFWDATQTLSLGNIVELGDDPVTSAALSVDGKSMATSKPDGIQLQNSADNQLIDTFANEHVGRINNVVFSPNEETLLTMGEDNKILVWDTATHTRIGDPLPGSSGAFSPDGKLVAVQNNSNNNYTVTVWDLASEQKISDPISGLNGVFSPDGKFLAISNENGNTTTLWDVKTKKAIDPSLRGQSVTFSPDGRKLIVTDWNINPNTVTLFDLISKKIIGAPFQGYIANSVANDDVFVLIDVTNKTTTFWGWKTMRPVAEPISGSDAYFSGTTPDILFVRDNENTQTTIWNPVTMEQIGKLEGLYYPNVSPDGHWMFIVDADTTTIWDLKTQTQVREFTGQYYPTFCSDKKTAAWFDGKSLTGSVWDLETDQLIGETEKMDEHSKDYGLGMTFSPNCAILALGQGWDNKTRLWDISKKDYVNKNIIDGTYILFSPSGSIALVQNYWTGFASFWNVPDATPVDDVAPIKSDQVVNINPKNNNIAAIINYDWSSVSFTTSIWNLNKHTRVSDDTNGYYYPVFTSDGELVIYGDQSVLFWDVEQNEKIGEALQGHTALITNMLFSPDGKFLASLASDGIVITDLDKKSNTHLQTDYTGRFTGMMFSPQGEENRTLTALGADGTVLIWKIPGDAPADKINAIYKPYVSSVYRPTLSPDGKYLVYESSQKISVSDIANPKEIIGETDDLTSCCGGVIAFTPDGKSLFYNDGATIYQWEGWNNPAEGSEPKRLLSTGQVNMNSLNLIMGAQAPLYLLVGYNDQASNPFTQIWDLSQNSKIGDPISGNIQVYGSSFETQILIYKDGEGRLIKFDLNPQIWRDLLCERAGRNFTREEWDQYISDAKDYPTDKKDAACQWDLDLDITPTATP